MPIALVPTQLSFSLKCKKCSTIKYHKQVKRAGVARSEGLLYGMDSILDTLNLSFKSNRPTDTLNFSLDTNINTVSPIH